MADYLVKATAYNNQVRAYAVRATEMINEAQRRHRSWPTASAALGRAMTVGVILGAMLKDEDRLTVRINGGGPIGTILVDANAKGEARGYVTNPQTHFELNSHGKLDVSRAVGTEGELIVSKDIGLKEPFVGHSPIISGELGEDFTSYLVRSEQTPSSVGAGVIVNPDNSIQAAGGFVIQLMPGTEEEVINVIERRLEAIPSISNMVMRGLTPEQILEQVLGEGNIKFLETMPVKFHCPCSRERVSNAIISLGSEEIADMIHVDKQADAHCHFCNEHYYYNVDDLEGLLEVTTS